MNTPTPGYGRTDFPEVVMLPEIVLDSRNPAHWERIDIDQPPTQPASGTTPDTQPRPTERP